LPGFGLRSQSGLRHCGKNRNTRRFFPGGVPDQRKFRVVENPAASQDRSQKVDALVLIRLLNG
jgi:hypothetical protein